MFQRQGLNTKLGLLTMPIRTTQTRSPKQIGDFGEGLVTYALIRGGFEVAVVDHVGADLIAEKSGERIAVSVKTRRFELDRSESEMITIENAHLGKLKHFSDQFKLVPVFAHVFCDAKTNTIHLFMIRVSDIELNMKRTNIGYSLSFSAKNLSAMIKTPGMKYSSWSNESIDVL